MARLLVSQTASTSSAGSASGLVTQCSIGEEHVDRAQLGGERGDRGGVADVEHARLDLRGPGGQLRGDLGGGVADAAGVARSAGRGRLR